jgi:FkbM family methyltransferase
MLILLLNNIKKYIFDLGAYDGADGLMLALLNPTHNVYAFEANPEQCKIIRKNKKIIESFFFKFDNFKIFNFAIGNKNKISLFNIAVNPTVSSLNIFKKDVFKYWPLFEIHFRNKKTIKIQQIKLYNFCKNQKIKHIDYIHSDLQGSDLDAFKGLNNFIYSLPLCKMECSLDKNRSIYEKDNYFKEVKKYMLKNFFNISKIVTIPRTFGNQIDIFFSSSRCSISNVHFDYKFSSYLEKIFLKKNTFIDNVKILFRYKLIFLFKNYKLWQSY